MKFQRRTFGSRVARRVFAMLIVCAFVPVGIFAAYTLLEVQRTMVAQQPSRKRPGDTVTQVKNA